MGGGSGGVGGAGGGSTDNSMAPAEEGAAEEKEGEGGAGVADPTAAPAAGDLENVPMSLLRPAGKVSRAGRVATFTHTYPFQRIFDEFIAELDLNWNVSLKFEI